MKNVKNPFEDRSPAGPHMTTAKAVADLVQRLQQDWTQNLGDTPAVRQHATNCAFGIIERELNLSRSSARLYIRCHQRFGTNPEAIQHLRLTDMGLLNGASDELVAFIVQAKKTDPDLPRSEVKRLIDACRGPGHHQAPANA
jgi:hypothetical protein